MKWVIRKTVLLDVHNLPYDDEDNLLIEDISTVRLSIPGYSYPVDLGSLCYTHRRNPFKDTTSEKCSLIEVVLSSLEKKRVPYISGVIDYMNNYISLGKSVNSVKSSYSQLLIFILWCDKNYPHGLNNIEQSKKAIQGFTNHLISRVRMSDLNINTAASYQLIAVTISRWVFNDEYGLITNGLRRLRRSYRATNVTSPPDEAKAKLLINTYFSIFNQLTEFLLENGKFPMKLAIQDKGYWFFPNSLPLISHKKLQEGTLLKNRYFAFNYKNGTINSIENITKKINWSSSSNTKIKALAKKIKKEAEKKIESANSSKSHPSRIYGAIFAMQSFTMLFCAHTGMNLGQVSNLKWNKDNKYKIENGQQGFKTIKCRANNKQVYFYIKTSFLKEFRTYLKLRKYLLDSFEAQETELLFFRITSKKILPIGMSLSTYYHDRIHRLFDIEDKITTRQWRSFKSDWLIKNTDLRTTAQLLQNSQKSVLKHYIEGSKSESEHELSNYYSNLEKIVLDQKNRFTKTLNIGQCVDYKNPKEIDKTIPYQPNCKNSKGCLFCKNFAVHADFTDLRKLYSYKYVILQTRILSESNEQFDKINSKILQRINIIIEKILTKLTISSDEIKEIKEDIFIQENLSAYWLRKLEMLIELELI